MFDALPEISVAQLEALMARLPVECRHGVDYCAKVVCLECWKDERDDGGVV